MMLKMLQYVLSNDLKDVELSDYIRDFVSKHKPDYMVPSYVIRLDSIPLTVNGKVDRRALPEVDLDSLLVEYVAPTNETERVIVDAFEGVFNRKGIGLYDDFVRLGGDSISAIRVISLLEKKDISCKARDILKYKTPYLIAKNISELVEVYYDAVEGEVDLLPIQNYFFNQVNSNNFSQEFILKFNVDLDVNILQSALDELSNVHDMLRAVYSFDGDNNPVQEILPLNTRVCDINEHVITDNFDENIYNLFIKSTGSLNVENKLIDVNLIHYKNYDYFVFVIHHLIVDGVSWNILLNDLTHIYFNLLEGEDIGILRPYPYKLWVDDVKKLIDDISDSEKEYWIEVNSLLDDSLIKGHSNVFAFNVESNFNVDNLLMLSEEEYLALAISRAYKKTYGKDIIFNRESYGRDESIANLNRTIGWFTSVYPVPVKVNNKKDSISLMSDVYSIKSAFNDIQHLGLNYLSLIYITGDLEYKHCPVTFNFLSSEFEFKNELFESINHYLSENDEISIDHFESESYGITFNVHRVESSYIVNGDYAAGTYIGDKFNEFIESIKDELSFIGNYEFDDIVCCLSESQLGVYLDEKVHDKGTAYSAPGLFECDDKYSIDEIRDAIGLLIDRHPILKGRVLETDDLPLLVCDTYPEIEIVNVDDYSELIKPFNLNKGLARFFIIKNDEGKFIVYDMHHIISDATSRGIIDRDLNLAFNGDLDSEVDLGFVYASRNSFESRFGSYYDSAHEFFNCEFADIDDVPVLLSDIDGCIGSVSLPIRGIRESVESFVHKNGITVGNFLNAVFAYTYSRFTGGDKVYYTFTENGRHEEYSLDALGMFVRTIPILVDCSDKSVVEYVSGVSDLILESISNSVYPFRLLASEFNLTKDIVFEYNYDLNDVSDIGEDIIFSDEADSVSELLCVVNDLDDGFVVNLNHLDEFSQDTAERFVYVFKEVLIQFLEKQNLADINYISNTDIELLNAYNETEHDLIYDDILDAFNDNLAKFPDNNLVLMNESCYSFAACAFIADRIARKLMDFGVKLGDCVGFLTERSEYYMFAILGIMSVGSIYVPLDDNHPDERIKFMLKDTASKVLIVSDMTYNRGKELDNDIILLNITDILEGDIGSLDNLPVVYNDLACILYTSGSTGLPKGVKISRKAILNFVEFYINDSGINNNDVYGLFAPIGFDVAIKGIFSSIYVGNCLNIIPNEIKLDINALNDYFIKHNITYTHITTQIAKLFVNNIKESSLKVLVTGGEKLGEIEACVYVTSINGADKIDSSSVGNLLNNTKAYILDAEKRRVPFGAVGELYLSGNQIARGYLNLEKETEESFLDNPFDDNEEYDVIYRTGDIACILPSGELSILGRRDGQVKIRGNRVELSEVESIIRIMDEVNDVTVQTIKNDGNNELVAYVVLSYYPMI